MSARLDIALDHHRAGRLAQAIDGYRAVLAAEPGDPTAEAMLGVALSQSGDPRAGLARLKRAVALVPDDAGLFENIGACLDRYGAIAAANAAYLRSAAIDPVPGTALAAAGASFILMKIFPSACRRLRQALAISPSEARWWSVAGEGASEFGQPDSAIVCFRRAVTLGVDHVGTLSRLAEALMSTDQVELAAPLFEEILLRARASRWFRPDFASQACPSACLDGFFSTSEPRLRHDLLHLEYLVRERVLPESFVTTIDRYRGILARLSERSQDGCRLLLSQEERSSIEEVYDRIIHVYRTKPVGSDVLSRSTDWVAAERRYLESRGGIVVVDDLLSEECLVELRRFCVESTIWFGDRHPGGYLGALLREGFCDPLLFRISRELVRWMPAIFRGLPLRQMWAFKYDSRLEGTALHADAAAVNVNFWITPDEANLSEGRGGLVVFDKRAPADWEFEKFNNDQAAIRSFLEDSGARSVVVPYRCNRAVIFHSDLFHRTDDLFFRDDYASRRINVTMLFGQRGA
jgi:tetratricopeptide (TPR) repeat protein